MLVTRLWYLQCPHRYIHPNWVFFCAFGNLFRLDDSVSHVCCVFIKAAVYVSYKVVSLRSFFGTGKFSVLDKVVTRECHVPLC